MTMNSEKVAVGKKLVGPRKPYVPDDDQKVVLVTEPSYYHGRTNGFAGGLFQFDISDIE